jgi:hypothetical protein
VTPWVVACSACGHVRETRGVGLADLAVCVDCGARADDLAASWRPPA